MGTRSYGRDSAHARVRLSASGAFGEAARVNFEGFPASGVDFFQQLAGHNEQEWFEAHRKVWDDEVAPAMLA